MLGSDWEHFGIILGSIWDHHGISLGFWKNASPRARARARIRNFIFSHFLQTFCLLLNLFWTLPLKSIGFLRFGLIFPWFFNDFASFFANFLVSLQGLRPKATCAKSDLWVFPIQWEASSRARSRSCQETVRVWQWRSGQTAGAHIASGPTNIASTGSRTKGRQTHRRARRGYGSTQCWLDPLKYYKCNAALA